MTLVNTATTNFNSLKDNITITSPNVSEFTSPDLSTVPVPSAISNSSLTTKVVNGTGIFDELMSAINAQLIEQFNNGRIVDDNFAEVYSNSLVQAMQIGSQFLITREQTYFNNLLIQEQLKQAKLNTVILKANLEKAKLDVQTSYLQVQLLNAQFSNAKAELATLNAQYDNLIKQGADIDAGIDIKIKQIETMNKDILVKNEQITNLQKDLLVKQEQIDTSIKQQLLLDVQRDLVQEQTETEHAKTSSTKTNGGTIGGITAKDLLIKQAQIDLYNAQEKSYEFDSKHKVASMYSQHGWVVQKNADDATTAPTQYTASEINEVLLALRNAAGMGS